MKHRPNRVIVVHSGLANVIYLYSLLRWLRKESVISLSYNTHIAAWNSTFRLHINLTTIILKLLYLIIYDKILFNIV